MIGGATTTTTTTPAALSEEYRKGFVHRIEHANQAKANSQKAANRFDLDGIEKQISGHFSVLSSAPLTDRHYSAVGHR